VLPLTTPRLRIVMLRAEHAATLSAYRNLPAVARYQDWPLPFTLEAALSLAADQALDAGPAPGIWVQLAVQRGGVMIGDLAVGLDQAGTEATIGFTIAPEYWGHGYAREAAGALVGTLTAAGVQRILATVDPANLRSRRLLEGLGFVTDGVIGQVLIRGALADDLTYAHGIGVTG
jgi:aminoglycoside 6'-N-acetyltransferase